MDGGAGILWSERLEHLGVTSEGPPERRRGKSDVEGTENEEAAGGEGATEALDRRVRRVLGEIEEDVPAEDEIELAGRFVQNVSALEGRDTPDRVGRDETGSRASLDHG